MVLDVVTRKAKGGGYLGIESESVNRYGSLQRGNLDGKIEFLSHLFVIVVSPQYGGPSKWGATILTQYSRCYPRILSL